MKLSDLIREYGDIEITEEMIAQKFKPNKGDWYWWVSTIGEVRRYKWDGDELDSALFEKRNVYRTEKEARFALDMHKFCKERSFNPNWHDENESKYYLLLNFKERVVHWCNDTYFCSFPPFYYPTLQAAGEVIEKYSFDELAKYYGRV